MLSASMPCGSSGASEMATTPVRCQRRRRDVEVAGCTIVTKAMQTERGWTQTETYVGRGEAHDGVRQKLPQQLHEQRVVAAAATDEQLLAATVAKANDVVRNRFGREAAQRGLPQQRRRTSPCAETEGERKVAGEGQGEGARTQLRTEGLRSAKHAARAFAWACARGQRRLGGKAAHLQDYLHIYGTEWPRSSALFIKVCHLALQPREVESLAPCALWRGPGKVRVLHQLV